MKVQLTLFGEEAMLAFGKQLASCLHGQMLVTLRGDLGAGKTTLSRGILRGLGHTGSVKSPTYTLVEPYQLADRQLFHFDLYRLTDPEELEYMGFRDYLESGNLCLLEWPERGQNFLPQEDMAIEIAALDGGRKLTLEAFGDIGIGALAQLQQLQGGEFIGSNG